MRLRAGSVGLVGCGRPGAAARPAGRGGPGAAGRVQPAGIVRPVMGRADRADVWSKRGQRGPSRDASMFFRPFLLALGLLGLCGAAAGQVHKDVVRGFRFKPPKEYVAVAISPGDFLTVAKYQGDQTDTYENTAHRREFELSFWPVGKSGEEVVAEGDPTEEDPEKAGPATRGADGKKPKATAPKEDENEEDESTDALADFVKTLIERSYGYCEIESEKEFKLAGGRALEYTLASIEKPVKIYLALAEQPDGRFVFAGTSLVNRYDKAKLDFAKATRSFERIEKADQADHEAALKMMSEQDRFLQRQIDKLPPGWDHLRTKRYLLLFNAEKDFVKDLADRIEAMRNVYEQHYPPTKPIEAVSIVRVCNSVEEYMGYGGPSGTGGYWNSRERELVFFDYRPRELTMAVLNHEAFHQYIYYFYGELSPHSWYNEGTGDYYAGAKLTKSNRVSGYGDAPGGIGRLGTIKEAARLMLAGKKGSDGACAKVKDVMRFTQREYYGSAGYDGGILYAQGWSIVHYLREGKGLDPKWQRILPDYLVNLVEARQLVAEELMKKDHEEAEKAEKGSSEKMSQDPADWYERLDEDTVQSRAHAKTFKDWTDADWDKFQAAWLKYVEKL
jgi:hypothetical protein